MPPEPPGAESGAPRALSVSLRVAPGRRAAHALCVDVSVPPGVSALCGPSGVGKTTVLRAIAGLYRPEEGRIALGDRILFDHARGIDLPPERRGVGFVLQSLALFPHLTALQNVAYGVPRAAQDREGAARRWLERMHVGQLAARKPASFSGGEAQRVALARALATAPRLLLLDEPFTALDEALRRRLGAEVAELVDELGIPCILVTHDRTEAARLASRGFELSEGRLEAL
jgi:molybdate transport system ATP-binding protein